jgi:hypothetical protein
MIAIIALAVLAVIPSSAGAQGACSAQGSMGPLPVEGFNCDNAVFPGDQFEIIYSVTNNSVGVPAGTPVAADLRGVVTDTLACEDSLCLVKLPPVLTFIDGGDNGCVARAPGVGSCASGGDNQVLVTMVGDGVQIPAGGSVLFVEIRVELTEAIEPNMCVVAFTRADSEVGGLVVDDPLCFPGITGQAGGASLLHAIPVELESFEID